MDPNSFKTIIKVALDLLCLCLVGFPILILYLAGDPYKRGFYCDDETIRYPYLDSTVPSEVLYVVGLGLPIVTIIITEAVHYINDKSKYPPYKFLDYDIPSFFVLCYKCIGIFGFAAASSQLITDVGKYTIGRLRPHFMAVCKPNINCTSEAKWTYITDYVCTSGETAKRIRDARLSFPSGHSSFSAVTMVFVILYLQERFAWKQTFLLKHLLQFVCFTMTWATALSRVSNYKHHWSDVCVGLIIGTSVALLTRPFIKAVFRKKKEKEFYLEENNTSYLQPIAQN